MPRASNGELLEHDEHRCIARVVPSPRERDERHDGARDEGSRHTHLVEEVSRVPEQS